MKKRYRFRKFLSSIFKTHTDPKKEILAYKKDIEKRMEKIMKLISKESDASANSFEKSELASLINDFYHGYQTLYEHYDHMIGKLSMKVHYKREASGGSPFAFGSSETESSDLGSEDWQVNEIQTGDSTTFAKLSDFERDSADLAERQLAIEKLENNLQTMAESIKILQDENGDLKQKLGIFSQEQANMNQRTRNFNEQNENLISEETNAFNRPHGAEKTKGECTLDEISKPSSDNRELEKEMEERAQLVDDLNQQLSNTDKQKEALRSESFVQEAEKAWADHRDEADQNLKLTTDRLSTENEQLSVNENFKLKLEHSQRNGDELNQRSAASEEEKRALESEILRSSYQMQEAENTIQNQILTIDRLSSENVQLLSENENLKLKLEHSQKNKNVLNQKLAAINKEKRALESEILRSHSQIHEAEETIKNLTMDSELLKDKQAKLLNIFDDEQLYVLQLEHKEDVEKTQEAQDKKEVLPVKTEKIKNMNSQLLLNCGDLKQKLEARNQEASELKQRLETTNGEKHSSTRENLALSSKIEQVKINFNDLKAQVEQLENDKSQLLIKLNDMDLELEGTKLQLSGLNNELGAAANKIRTLALENSRAMSEFKLVDACNKVLEHELKQMKDENLILQGCKSKLEKAEEIIDNLKAEAEQLRSGKSQLQIEIGDLNLKLETMNLQLTDMNRKIGVAKEEKNASTLEQLGANGKTLETELQQLKEKKSILQQNYEHLYNQVTDQERLVEETTAEVLAVQRKPEVLKEASIHANERRMEPDLLHIQKNKVDEQRKIISDGCSENHIPMNSIEDKLTSKIFNQETMLEDLSSSFHALLMACKQFRDQYQELRAKFHCAENVDKEQKKEKGNLLESCNEFLAEFAVSESEKAEADKDIAKLHRHVQTLYVQLRLSNQKLKTAKSENREREERQRKMVEVLQEKCTELEEQKYTSGEKLDFSDNELTRVKIAANSGISALDTRFHELETLFEQKHSQILSRLVICTEEIKTLKSEPEKERLMDEKHELTVRSKDKDEIILKLRDEAVSLGAKLAEKEKDLEKLMRNMDESEKKIEDLERRLKKKEEEVEARNDEKREAIRQLCLSIEYHREKYDHLSQCLPAMLERTGRSL